MINGIAFSGIQCPQCLYIFYGRNQFEIHEKCPICNFSGAWWVFPSGPLCKILTAILNHSKHEFIAVILTCTLFECMLQNFLKQYMGKLEINDKLILKKHRNIEEQIKILYKSFIGKSFKESIQETELKNYYDEWKEIKKKRNLFIHGNVYAIGTETVEKSIKLSKNTFSLFAWLNNKYIHDKKHERKKS